ncbi:MAG: hypothetical protein JWR84_29 [Caulobacter sp.]|nr:hypothetical protein [Caulobacter sp.]
MTSRIAGESFWERVSGVAYADLVLADCEFNSCTVARDPGSPRNTFDSIELINAGQLNCSISEAVLRDVQLRGLKRLGSAPLFLWGCLFERVTLSGRISALKINSSIVLPGDPPARQELHDAAVAQFYSNSDWALDISDAEFPGGVTFEAIPGDKVRRDPARQVLIRRTDLAKLDWRSIDFDATAIDIGLSWFEQGSLFDSVVLASRADRKWAKRDLAVFQRLRDTGIASA